MCIRVSIKCSFKRFGYSDKRLIGKNSDDNYKRNRNKHFHSYKLGVNNKSPRYDKLEVFNNHDDPHYSLEIELSLLIKVNIPGDMAGNCCRFDSLKSFNYPQLNCNHILP